MRFVKENKWSVMCTETEMYENGETEGQKGLYLAGADSSSLFRPGTKTYRTKMSVTSCFPCPHTQTHTNTHILTHAQRVIGRL